MIKLRRIVMISLYCASRTVYADSNNSNIIHFNNKKTNNSNFVEMIYQAGHPLCTSSSTKNLMVNDFSQQFQLVFGHQYNSVDYGDYVNGQYYPIIGVNVSYGDFSHVKLFDKENSSLGESVYGRFYSLSFHFSRYLHIDNNVRIKSIIENGVSYSTDPYSSKNIYTSIGGHLQQYFSYGMFVAYYRSGIEYALGPQFSHHSNSGAYRPNKGINNIALSGRVKFNAEKDIPRCVYSPNAPSFKPYIFHNVSLDYGCHVTNEQYQERKDLKKQWIDAGCPDGSEWSRAQDNHFTIYSDLNFSYGFMYQTNPKFAYGIGLDYFYAFGTDYLRKYHIQHGDNNLGNIHRSYIGASFRNEVYVKNFAINLHVGYYLNDKHVSGTSSYTRFYERIGMKYYTPNLIRPSCKGHSVRPFFGYFIKGNLFNAEQFELCTGLSFF